MQAVQLSNKHDTRHTPAPHAETATVVVPGDVGNGGTQGRNQPLRAAKTDWFRLVPDCVVLAAQASESDDWTKLPKAWWTRRDR